jgi:hypothetical protein
MEAFDLPLGLRLWPSEHRAGRRYLREGYAFSLLENSSDSFRFSVLAGAAKIDSLFRSLSAFLPEESFLILEFYEEDGEKTEDGQTIPTVYYSPYLPTSEILKTIEPYLPRMIHDGFVGFGLANNRSGMEFFYSEEKVLTCFTGDHLRTMDVLCRHGLPYRPRLFFPTDLGHDHLSLQCHHRRILPPPFSSMSDADLDYLSFCNEITELLDMYPVEEDLSFFLSKKEQDFIETRLLEQEEYAEFAEEDFGVLLLDWHDFVGECEAAFEGDLWEYRQGLKLRDMFQFVIDGVPDSLGRKIKEILAEADERFQQLLVDRRKRLDPPQHITSGDPPFWYRGVVRNQGVCLRRDLIRQGWFKP